MDTRRTNSYPAASKMSFKVSNFLNGVLSGYDSGMVSPTRAICSYNFDFSGGSLKSGAGFSEGLISLFDESIREQAKIELESLGSIIRTFVYRNYDTENQRRNDKLFLLNSSLSLFSIDLAGGNLNFTRIRNIVFTSVPKAISYKLGGKDVLIFASPTDNMVVYDGENQPYEVLDAPKITSMDVHFERLFVTTTGEKSEVLFSDDLDPTNWSIDLSEAGYIEMVDERGALNRVISFNDYLYKN